MRQRPGIAVLALAAGLLTATQATAEDRGRVVALFLFARDPAMSPFVTGLEASLRAHASEIPTLRLTPPQKLPAGDREPKSSSKGCGATLSCIARMGRDVGADEIMFGRIVTPPDSSSGALLQLIAVSSREAEIVRKIAFPVESPGAADAVVVSHWAAIYGVDGLGRVEVPGSTTELRVDGVVVGVGPGPFDLAAGPHELAVADRRLRVLVLPGETVQAAELVPAPEAHEPMVSVATTDPGATDEHGQPLSITAPAPAAGDERGHLLAYSGVALGGLGLAALGAGAYYASSSRSINEEVAAVRPGAGTTQVEADELNERAANAARNANIFLVAGAAATAIGATLLALDLWILDSDATASVVALGGADGLYARVTLTW